MNLTLESTQEYLVYFDDLYIEGADRCTELVFLSIFELEKWFKEFRYLWVSFSCYFIQHWCWWFRDLSAKSENESQINLVLHFLRKMRADRSSNAVHGMREWYYLCLARGPMVGDPRFLLTSGLQFELGAVSCYQHEGVLTKLVKGIGCRPAYKDPDRWSKSCFFGRIPAGKRTQIHPRNAK